MMKTQKCLRPQLQAEAIFKAHWQNCPNQPQNSKVDCDSEADPWESDAIKAIHNLVTFHCQRPLHIVGAQGVLGTVGSGIYVMDCKCVSYKSKSPPWPHYQKRFQVCRAFTLGSTNFDLRVSSHAKYRGVGSLECGSGGGALPRLLLHWHEHVPPAPSLGAQLPPTYVGTDSADHARCHAA